jgi:predicted NUDIX family NTP pyrophosphohydrolase
MSDAIWVVGQGATKAREHDLAGVSAKVPSRAHPAERGTRRRVPEINRATWFDADAARGNLVAAQAAFVGRLLERLR